MKINGWSRVISLFVIVMLCLVVTSNVNSVEPKKQKQQPSLRKPGKAIDVATALLDAGQAQHMMLNSHLSAFG